MSDLNVTSAPNVKVAYIVTENGLNKYKPCPVLTINVADNENIKLLQISDNNKSVTVNQPVKVLNLPKSKPNDEFTIANSKNNIVYRVLRPEDLDLKAPILENIPKPYKRTKQKKLSINEETEEKESSEIPKKVFRTRSGRMSKPPKHIQQQDELPQLLLNINSSTEEKWESTVECKAYNESIETKSSNIVKHRASTESKEKKSPKTVENKRNISSQYRCGTCKKAYLGQNKMLKHLQLNPGHEAPDFSKKSSKFNLWSELIKKTKDFPKNQQSKIFCTEIVNLIEKARFIIPKILKPADKEKNYNFTVDSTVSNALGIPEGNYSFDEDLSVVEVAKSDNKTNSIEITDCLINTDSENIQNGDQNSLLNLLDTGQVTFDSSTNSEEVMNVDRLVNERLKTLTGGELEPNNATQNLSLDLSLDMFSYPDS